MTRFGQGAQLVVLPHGKAVALNLVVKTGVPERMPWQAEYADGYGFFPVAPLMVCPGFWAFLLLMCSSQQGDASLTFCACAIAVVAVLCVVACFIARRSYSDEMWREYDG